jgi:hypothetical protein
MRIDTIDAAQGERQRFGHHESTIRQSGWLYLLSAAFTMGFGYGEFHMAANSTAEANVPWGAFLLVTGIAQFVCSFGLFALARWVWVPACLLSALGLLGVPYGTAIHALVLWFLLSVDGRRVFQADYKRIVATTKRVKRKKSSAVGWLFLILVGIVVLYCYCLGNAQW